MKCDQCGGEIPENEVMEIIGMAEVTGEATLKAFFEHGVAWMAGSSYSEKTLCPLCDNFTRVQSL